MQERPSHLFGLVPILCNTGSMEIKNIKDTYEDDLPNPVTLELEYTRWQRKWAMEICNPDCLQDALKLCDRDTFPNLHVLLHIRCTLPVTTAETERNNSALKLLKNYLCTTMSTEKLSGLALMKICYRKDIDIEKIVELQICMQVSKCAIY